ncbi:DUF3108 domain-containing protein [bacterium]|nr:DUF3108 domain-containing protein [bacterium]
MNLKHVLYLCFTCGLLVAAPPNKVIRYEVSYIGIPLLDMTLKWIENDSTVSISYDNQLKPLIAYFHSIHNVYRVSFDKNSFSPFRWSKTVREGDFKFQLNADLSSDRQKVHFSNGHVMDFPKGAFTIFSATHFLAAKATQTDFFPAKVPVFIDGELWVAGAQRFDKVNPHPNYHVDGDEVLIQIDLHYLRGKRVIKKNDVLTSVIASEGTRLLLWVLPDGTYIKAQFGKFPKAVVLNRVKN